MKIFFTPACILMLIFNFSFFGNYVTAQAPSWAWAKTAGSTASEYGRDIATDAAGNSYVTGYFTGTANFGTLSIACPTGSFSVFTAKYDANGNCLWVRQLGGISATTNATEGSVIDIDAVGNCYVAGRLAGPFGSTVNFASSVLTCKASSEIFVIKYDSNGNELWARQSVTPSSPNGFVNDMVTDAAGNVYITGTLSGSSVFGSFTLTTCPYIVKYNTSGTEQWAVEVLTGSAGAAGEARAIDLDASGNLFITGYLKGSVSFATSPVTNLTGNVNKDVFLAKVAGATGAFAWVKQFSAYVSSGNNNPSAYGNSLNVDGSGNTFITGTFEGNVVFGTTTLTSRGAGALQGYVAKMDLSGNVLWARQSIGSSLAHMVYAEGITTNNAGDCFLTGYYYPSTSQTFCGLSLPNSGSQIAYILKISSVNGTALWGNFSSGNGSSSFGYNISLDASDNAYMVGINQGTQVFGTNTITSNGNIDVLIAKLNASTTSTVVTSINGISHVEGSVNFYPNPFNTNISLSINGFEGAGSLSMKLFDLLGREVRSFENISSGLFSIDRGDIASGVYYFKLTANSEVIKTGKIIAE